MISDHDPRIEAGYRSLQAYWDEIGPSDRDLLAYMINPQFQGKPPWPNTRQAYRIVRPPDALIIASDGLSDPFVGSDIADRNGFDMEVFIETPDFVGADFTAVRDSWAFSLIENFALNVANWGGIAPQLRRHGITSTEFPIGGILPADWLGEGETAGFLVNMPAPGRRHEVAMPLAPVLIVCLTLLRPAELAYVASGGAQARREMATRLETSGFGHRCSLARPSLV
jgi:hypothetical protein